MLFDDGIEAVNITLNLRTLLTNAGQLIIKTFWIFLAIRLNQIVERLRVADVIILESVALAGELRLLIGKFGRGEAIFNEAKVKIKHEIG